VPVWNWLILFVWKGETQIEATGGKRKKDQERDKVTLQDVGNGECMNSYTTRMRKNAVIEENISALQIVIHCTLFQSVPLFLGVPAGFTIKNSST
jgi:hypothetical protein